MVRDAFSRRGWDALSIDLRAASEQASRRAGEHRVMDVRDYIKSPDFRTRRLVVAHPDCTYLTNAGWHWNHRIHGRHACSLYAIHNTKALFASLDQWCDEDPERGYAVENPIGVIGTHVCPPHAEPQTLQPFNYGADASKATVLWLRRLRRLRPTERVPGRIVDDGRAQLGLFGTGVERWSNQTDAGQNRLPPTEDRWSLRSETYPGIADAMAEQWS